MKRFGAKSPTHRVEIDPESLQPIETRRIAAKRLLEKWVVIPAVLFLILFFIVFWFSYTGKLVNINGRVAESDVPLLNNTRIDFTILPAEAPPTALVPMNLTTTNVTEALVSLAPQNLIVNNVPTVSVMPSISHKKSQPDSPPFPEIKLANLAYSQHVTEDVLHLTLHPQVSLWVICATSVLLAIVFIILLWLSANRHVEPIEDLDSNPANEGFEFGFSMVQDWAGLVHKGQSSSEAMRLAEEGGRWRPPQQLLPPSPPPQQLTPPPPPPQQPPPPSPHPQQPPPPPPHPQQPPPPPVRQPPPVSPVRQPPPAPTRKSTKKRRVE